MWFILSTIVLAFIYFDTSFHLIALLDTITTGTLLFIRPMKVSCFALLRFARQKSFVYERISIFPFSQFGFNSPKKPSRQQSNPYYVQYTARPWVLSSQYQIPGRPRSLQSKIGPLQGKNTVRKRLNLIPVPYYRIQEITKTEQKPCPILPDPHTGNEDKNQAWIA